MRLPWFLLVSFKAARLQSAAFLFLPSMSQTRPWLAVEGLISKISYGETSTNRDKYSPFYVGWFGVDNVLNDVNDEFWTCGVLAELICALSIYSCVRLLAVCSGVLCCMGSGVVQVVWFWYSRVCDGVLFTECSGLVFRWCTLWLCDDVSVTQCITRIPS